MEAIAVQKHVRMSPRKLRLVADSVRGLTPLRAIEMLPYVEKRAAKPLEKVIRAAIANAKVKGAKEEELVFKELQIGEGRTLKRMMAVSRGQGHSIMKRMSHIRVVLESRTKDSGKKKGVSK
jgi:large subunit ribosomal protein L22